jgi:ABC-type phosphate transport system substrate-binding protein
MKRFLLIVLLLVGTPSAMAATFQVIVNADNPATSLPAKTVQDFFLGKTTKWSDGTIVVAIDQIEKSAVREAFSNTVLKKKVEAVKSYWLTMIFSGRGTPPVELKTDAAVLDAVRTQRGAIGYVSGETKLVPGVTVITVK